MLDRLSWFSLGFMLFFLFSCAPKTAPAVPEKPAAREATSAAATKSDWEVEWEQVKKEARKEGKLVLYSGIGPDARQALNKALNHYGIELEAVLGRGNELSEKILRERKAGIYNVDFYLSGLDTIVSMMKPAGYLAPLEPLLILPEVRDPKFWYKGQLPWADKDKNVLAFDAYVDSGIHINTDIVKPGEINTMRDLLDPKWKGRIIMDDPTVAGRGSSYMVVTTVRLGQEFIKQLVDQKPVVTRDKRQAIDWVAKGRTPVGIGIYIDTYQEYKRAGAPVGNFNPKDVSYLLAGMGHLSYIDRAPHPNASRVFVNWLLSKEGQTLWGELRNTQSARIDTPVDHLLKSGSAVRQPNVEYYDTRNETFEFEIAKKWKEIVKETFLPLTR